MKPETHGICIKLQGPEEDGISRRLTTALRVFGFAECRALSRVYGKAFKLPYILCWGFPPVPNDKFAVPVVCWDPPPPPRPPAAVPSRWPTKY